MRPERSGRHLVSRLTGKAIGLKQGPMLDPIARTKFEADGFVRLPGLLPTPVLERLRLALDDLLVADTVPGKVVRDSPAGKVVSNIDHLIGWGHAPFLELLALPELMNVAAAICGDDLFPVQEFAVIKHRGDDNPVLWHQDMPNERSAPAVAFGLYLDDADAGQGALRYIPGSHRSDRQIAELAREPAVEVPAKAGDAIIHDLMVAHSSEPMEGRDRRRVIYVEFLSSELALGEGICTREEIDNRRRLLFLARRYRREAAPMGNCFKPRQRDPNSRDRKRPIGEVLSEIYDTPIRPRPAIYCFERIPANLADR
jgi:hypothetical protein